jgi:hypothetical protein
MTIHTPYDGTSKPFTIGLKPLDCNEWTDVDDHLIEYLDEKQSLYKNLTDQVLAAEEGTEEAQQEVLDLLLDYLPRRFPNHYKRAGHEMWVGDHFVFAHDNSKLSPLARAGQLIQEDLVLMRKSDAGWRLVAASLCFPSAWNLQEKFGKPMHSVHEQVPGFGQGTRNAGLIERMFDNLWPERPVMRWNWSLFGRTQLYHPLSESSEKKRFGEGSIAEGVTLRVERQTLRKLPKSGDILFTIRTYLDPLELLETHADGAALANAIREQISAFTPEELAYKGLTAELPRMIAKLDAIARENLLR